MSHPLLQIMLDAANGRPPTPDCSVELLPPPPCPVHAVLAFTAHSYVAAPVFADRDGGGVLLLGRGLAGRWEVAFEVEPDRRDRGLGRALAIAARHLVPRDQPLFAQVTPGNVASVRVLLAAGYAPIASEVLLFSSHENDP
jgi:GNAT superfamily N-acetyltransferase